MRIEVPAHQNWGAILSNKVQTHMNHAATNLLEILGFRFKIQVTEPRLEGNKYWVNLSMEIENTEEDEGDPGGKVPHGDESPGF